MNKQTQKKKSKKKALRALCVASALIIAAVITTLAMVLHTPQGYQPLPPSQDNQVSPYLTHKLAPDVHNNIQLDKPFDIIVPQDGFNEIIALGEWPQLFGDVTISRPAVAFAENTIVVMGTITISGLKSVITIITEPKLDDAGLLALNLKKVKAGSFNITGFAKLLTSRIMNAQLENMPEEEWLRNLAAAVSDNKPFEPVFPAYDKRIRLTNASIEDRELTLRFIPEP
jgi:hypothetical protein